MNLLAKLKRWQVVILTVLLSTVAYGALITKMGFYTDDWTFNWTYRFFGSEGLLKYFSTNRPFWGLMYQMTMPIFGDNIIAWHLFGLFWRIAASLCFYWFCLTLWPERKSLISAATLLFALYPGFLMQPLALTFGHIWIVYSIFLVSLVFTVKAVRNEKHRKLFTVLAVSLSLLNLLFMEYFLPLEVVRWAILFCLVPGKTGFWKRLGTSFKQWIPYLVVLFAVTIWRAFFFKDQTHIYTLGLMDAFKVSFAAGITQLWQALSTGLYQSSIYAWGKPFVDFIQRYATTNRNTYLAITAFCVLIFAAIWFLMTKNEDKAEQVTNTTSMPRWSGWLIAATALLLAGIPFYITGLEVNVDTFSSRFTLPFMVGAAMLLALLLDLIPLRWLRTGLLGLLLAASIGTHIYNGNDFRWMRSDNTRLMDQLAWRAPGLKPGTLVVTNEVNPIYTYTTMKAELNLVYPHDPDTQFGWIFARDLATLIPGKLKPDTVILIPALVEDYKGSGSDVVVFQYSENTCLRFIDSSSSYVAGDILENGYQNLSNPENLVFTGAETASLNTSLLGLESDHNWCYYFEKADLAVQLKDYTEVKKLYKAVVRNGLKPFDGVEWYPFVEGLASAGDFENAVSVSKKVIELNPKSTEYRANLCYVWDRVAANTDYDEQVTQAKAQLGCP